MAILNLGSLNIDRVFRVDHLVRPGETIAGKSLAEFAGGKGANQSVALARAGAQVAHLGKVGADGRWLVDKLAAEGVDTRFVGTSVAATGQAIIQVDDAGENSILLWPGANREITPEDVDAALAAAPAGGWLLVQNETSAVPYAIRRARERGLSVVLNPAPFDERVREYPLGLLTLLCVNQSEGAAMTGETAAEGIVETLACGFAAEGAGDCEILLTLGAHGAWYRGRGEDVRQSAPPVKAIDTTAAGDTFLGYFLAERMRGAPARQCLETATRAAALCVTRAGAMDSIPRLAEVLETG